MDRPRLRPLEVIPSLDDQGRRVIVLRDSLRLSEAVLVVPIPLIPVLQRLDGEHTLEQVRAECLGEHRIDIPEANLRQIVSQLDEAHFLDGEGFEGWRRTIERAFLAAPVRPSFLAGKSYEADPAALRARLDGFFTDPEGPGLPQLNGANGAPLRGLVAPHIDFHRGGPTFAWSYRALAERGGADLFVVLGTVHAPTQGFYTLTEKGFETPLGTLDTDREFIRALARRAPGDLFRDEFTQRAEHSIEFQAVFLQYLYGGRRPVKFVPLLVGSFGEFVIQGRSPRGDARVEGFVGALRGTLEEARAAGKRPCLVASVDLAHVGPQFGDADPVDGERLAALDRADRASLEAACRGDAEAFWWSVAEDGDARKVCGLAPIYTLLRTLDGCRGEVLRYSQWPDPNGTVTFCSVAIG